MKLFTNIKRNLLSYLIFSILSVSLVFWEFDILTSPKETEKIDILIDADSLDTQNFSKMLKDNQPDYLKEVNFRYNPSSNGSLNRLVMTYGDVEADIYILSKDALDKIDAASFFCALDESVSKSLFGNDIFFYEENNIKYGIKISCEYIEDNDTFYILFADDSLHLGSFTGSEYDGAIDIAKLFIGE